MQCVECWMEDIVAIDTTYVSGAVVLIELLGT